MKKAVSILLSFIMILTIFPIEIFASENENEFDGPGFDIDEEIKYGPDEAVLIGLLNERRFVVQTLTDKFIPKDNPNLGYTRNYLYTDILENYKDEEAYKFLVDVWYNVHNLGHFEIEAPDNMIEFLGGDEAWITFVAGVEDKKFEEFLSKILSSEYTSVSGYSTSSEQANLEHLRELYSNYEEIKNFMEDSFENLEDIVDINDARKVYYLENVLPTYVDEVSSLLSDIGKCADHSGVVSGEEKIRSVKSIYKATEAASFGYDDQELSKWQSSFILSNVMTKTKEAFEMANIVADFTESTMNQYMVYEAVLCQRETIISVLERSLNYGNENYDKAANKYIEFIRENDNPEKLVLNALINSAADLVEKELGEKVKELAEETFVDAIVNKLATSGVLKDTASIVSAASKAESIFAALGLIEIGADVCVNLTDLSEKTHELILLDEMRQNFNLQFQDDVENYIKAVEKGASIEKRNALAKKALDDLVFLKNIQLRANEIAYNMTKDLSDKSLVGKIEGWVTGSDATVGMEQSYEIIKNVLVETMINPYNAGILVVPAGATLSVYPTDDGNGLRGEFVTENGRTRIGELEYRMLEGIEVHGTLNVYADCDVAIIKAYGDINVYGNHVLSCLNLSGNFNLGGEGTLVAEGKYTCNNLQVQEGAKLVVGEFETIGNFNSPYRIIDVCGKVEVKGDLTVPEYSEFNILETGYVLVHGNYHGNGYARVRKGVFEAKGNVVQQSDYLPGAKLLLSGDEPQDVYGHFNEIVAINKQITSVNGFSAKKLLSDLNIIGDVPSLSIDDFGGFTVKVNGNAGCSGVKNGTLEVTGKLKTQQCAIYSDGRITAGEFETVGNFSSPYRVIDILGKVEVKGDLTVPEYSEFNIHETGHVIVHGNYHGSGYANVRKGVFEAKGDVIQQSDCLPGAELLLSGEKTQNISGQFTAIKAINKQITSVNGFSAQKLLSDLNIIGDVPSLSIDDFGGFTAKVNGNAGCSGVKNGTLEVTGKFKTRQCAIYSDGQIIAGEFETVGNYSSPYRVIDILGKVEVKGNLTVPEYSEFNIHETGHVIVHGNYHGNGYANVRKGLFEAKGNVIQQSDYLPGAELLLSGKKMQNISGYFTAIRATNRRITADSGFSVGTLLSDIYMFREPGSKISVGNYNGYSIIIPDWLYGDINEDGVIDVKDSYIARLIAAKLIKPEGNQFAAGDVDFDGKITAIDANFIRKYVIKMIDFLPV